ncbi:Flp pilus assembly protein CpaB [bacterium]|nr:MAG: Flp pilus assembly protein CpaB [bacterium]
MQRQKVILIISLVASMVLASIAVLLINAHLDQQSRVIKEQAKKVISEMQSNQVAVLVAKTNIPQGTVVTAGMFDTSIIPRQFVQPQAVNSMDRIAGMTAIVSISQGEQITLSKLIFAKQGSAAGGLASITPVGKRAIAISVDEINAVAGMVNPGDYIDILASIPIPTKTADGKIVNQENIIMVLQNVLVLAVGQNIGTFKDEQPVQESRYAEAKGKQQETRVSSPFFTLALTPNEAGLIAFVSEQSKVKLILRSPADAKVESLQPISWDTLFQYLMPHSSSQVDLQREEVDKKAGAEQEYIEIYRGLNKDKIPLSQ